MLVLSRKSCESVVIGSAAGSQKLLKVTVLQIRGKRVRLGFEGDPDLRIERAESRLIAKDSQPKPANVWLFTGAPRQ